MSTALYLPPELRLDLEPEEKLRELRLAYRLPRYEPPVFLNWVLEKPPFEVYREDAYLVLAMVPLEPYTDFPEVSLPYHVDPRVRASR